jgi:hypothetical protein
MRPLIVTLVHRQYGSAMASWAYAFRQWLDSRPDARFEHLKLYGEPAGLEDGHDIVTAKYQEAQRHFLAGDWDTFIAVEDDMVLPTDALERLERMLLAGVDIAYGLYVLRHGLSYRWNAYSALTEEGGRSVSQERQAAVAAFGQIIPVKGVGLGCTAIRREVLEGIDFRRGGPACNDWYLAVDGEKAGYQQRCDLGLVCGHMTMEPSPRIVWPAADDPQHLYRIEFL